MTTTTEPHKGNGNGNGKQSLGTQAAAAAMNTGNNVEKLGVVDPAALEDEDDDETDTKGAKRVPKRVFVVVGQVHEFKNNREAEKFLNGDGAPPEFRVIKGSELVRTQRVSLA